MVGGGYIGLELGTAYRKLGSEVTILEGTDSLLPGVDPSMVRMVTRRLKKLGVTVVTGAMVQGGESSEDEVQVTAQVKGEEKTFAADVVLVAVGRKPNTDELGLEQVGNQLDERGFIKVDKQLRTSVPHIYAIGDVAGGALLAHKASYEGKVAAEVIAGMPSEVDVRAMPFVIFSDPELAYTGLTEKEAKEKGYDPVVSRFSFQRQRPRPDDGFGGRICPGRGGQGEQTDSGCADRRAGSFHPDFRSGAGDRDGCQCRRCEPERPRPPHPAGIVDGSRGRRAGARHPHGEKVTQLSNFPRPPTRGGGVAPFPASGGPFIKKSRNLFRDFCPLIGGGNSSNFVEGSTRP